MPRADYYILAEADHDSREVFACRLCEKALSQGLKILIYTQNEADLNQLDHRLWSFRNDAFVPHSILNSDINAPVQLTTDQNADIEADLLINLGAEPPKSADRFMRVVEIVSQDPAVLQATRLSYKVRREAGWDLHRHDQRQS